MENRQGSVKCVVRGSSKLLEISTMCVDMRARVLFEHYTQELLELETELDRVCSHPHTKLVPQELFPGFTCIAYDSKLGLVSIITRREKY